MLGSLGVDVQERRYFNELPTAEEIRKLAARLPGGVMDLVSTRGRRYRELGLAGKELSPDEWVELLSREPGLWRRPIAIRGDKVIIGFRPDELTELAGGRTED